MSNSRTNVELLKSLNLGQLTAISLQVASLASTGAITGTTLGVQNTDSAAPNLFDWYEEATFVPGLLLGGGNTGMTISTAIGSYTRIGNRVAFDLGLALTALGSSTGLVTITGLPYAAARETCFNVKTNNMTGLTGTVKCHVPVSTIPMSLTQDTATGDNSFLTHAALSNTTVLTISGIYRVA